MKLPTVTERLQAAFRRAAECARGTHSVVLDGICQQCGTRRAEIKGIDAWLPTEPANWSIDRTPKPEDT